MRWKRVSLTYFDLVCINKISWKYEMRKHGANAAIALVRYARTRRTSGGD